DVEVGSGDGDHEQIAAHDVRARLVPERELGRDRRRLIDAGLDLARPKYLFAAGKDVDQRLATIGAVGAAREKGDGVWLARRWGRPDQDEFLAALAGQPRDHVVRFGARCLSGLAEYLLRNI